VSPHTDPKQHHTNYLESRVASYQKRKPRYAETSAVLKNEGLKNSDTLLDVGSGWTELDYHLRVDLDWHGRYIPIDGAIDGVDLEQWAPPHPHEWLIALELLEHLHNPQRLALALIDKALRGVVISTPNPAVIDVYAMDPTHITPISQPTLEKWGFQVRPCSLYGVEKNDGLIAWFTRTIKL